MQNSNPNLEHNNVYQMRCVTKYYIDVKYNFQNILSTKTTIFTITVFSATEDRNLPFIVSWNTFEIHGKANCNR